jgi:hypothetical protein
MKDQPGQPETVPVAKLDTLIDRFGGWEITRQIAPSAWAATRRPTPTHVELHCAFTLDELAAKLEHAEAQRRETLSRQVLAGELDDVPWYVVRH